MEEEWQQHKDAIIALYWDEDLDLATVQALMRDRHGFNKTRRQYRIRLNEWKLRKNVNTQEMIAIAHIRHDRANREGKATTFTLRGRIVPEETINRFLKRCPVNPEMDRPIDLAAIPGDLRYSTPAPDADEAPLHDQPAQLRLHAGSWEDDATNRPSSNSIDHILHEFKDYVAKGQELMWDCRSNLSQKLSHLSVWQPSFTPSHSAFSGKRSSSMVSWGDSPQLPSRDWNTSTSAAHWSLVRASNLSDVAAMGHQFAELTDAH